MSAKKSKSGGTVRGNKDEEPKLMEGEGNKVEERERMGGGGERSLTLQE
jgi:hypothetical protein